MVLLSPTFLCLWIDVYYVSGYICMSRIIPNHLHLSTSPSSPPLLFQSVRTQQLATTSRRDRASTVNGGLHTPLPSDNSGESLCLSLLNSKDLDTNALPSCPFLRSPADFARVRFAHFVISSFFFFILWVSILLFLLCDSPQRYLPSISPLLVNPG